MKGIYRYQKAASRDWARVELKLGEWTDLSKDEYDAHKIEPTFWALPEEESWRAAALGNLPS